MNTAKVVIDGEEIELAVDSSKFDAVYESLNLTKDVRLVISVEPPEGLRQSITDGKSAPQLDGAIADLSEEEILSRLGGAYGAQIDEEE